VLRHTAIEVVIYARRVIMKEIKEAITQFAVAEYLKTHLSPAESKSESPLIKLY
jgi:hypothetical protein